VYYSYKNSYNIALNQLSQARSVLYKRSYTVQYNL